MLGRRIGSWTLVRELGHGGMGSVFEARHASLNTQAAVKVLSEGLESRESFRQRFRREAELQAQLRHPNIARVLDYVEDNGQWFLVIEYLDRGSLADLLSRGEAVSRQQAIAWTRDALAGLGYAHRRGIVHRDIKPANMMLGAAGEIVVVDFGIARSDAASGLTATGITVGTPQYMSPEQIMTPNAIDGRADIYSLGVVLYELLAGRRPFESRSEFSALQAHVSEPPPPLHTIDPTIPPELEAVVMRALAKRPDERYADCDGMIRALDLVAAARASELMPGAVAVRPATVGGTVQQSMLYPKADAQNRGGPWPGELRDAKRRSFRRRLIAGTATILVVATLLAASLSNNGRAEDPTSETPSVVTDTTPTAPPPDPPLKTPDPPLKKPPVIDPIPFAPSQSKPPVAPPILPPPVPQLPSTPLIAVVGMGDDPMLAASLEQEMERRFAGYRVSDERGDPDLDELLGRGDVAPKTLGPQFLKSGYHILILLRVEKGDERRFRHDDQSLTMKSARIRLGAYLLPANRTLGPGWTELLEYTELSAAAKARQVFVGATADLRQAIDDEWARLRAGQR